MYPAGLEGESPTGAKNRKNIHQKKGCYKAMWLKRLGSLLLEYKRVRIYPGIH